MKTSEFIKFFEDEGFKVHKGNVIISVDDKNGNELFDISEKNSVDTDYIAFDNLPFEKQQEYYKVIFEYLMTPIEERKEDKKYYLKQIGLSDFRSFLNYGNSSKTYTVESAEESDIFKTQFTQEEIDNMPECYTHPAVWEQVPVPVEKCEEIDNSPDDYDWGHVEIDGWE